ncbi:TPA: HAMP domain-containing histidine kinase [Clostridioides difficile]|nr:HAMP domain-containing histidine kinase [Clostridioides difficile]
MNTSVYLLLILALSLIIIAYLVSVLLRVRIQLTLIKDALEDIKNGNLNRRILTDENDITKQICYDINEIAINSQFQLIQQKQSEQAYKQLMTSLSHDVKTPLASLVGYLEAVESKIVVGEEKDEYIHVASNKAHYLKNFVENLFEWVKLDSKEQVFHFDIFDLNELSRNIISDWIPVLESSHFEYEFDIPEIEYFLRIDANAYTRIINNLLQNIITHSSGNKMTLRIFENKEQAQIIITDNGKGISSDNLPHIFERLYQCDHSRSSKGNGLGLAIAKELINAHKGNITANSTPGMGTEFTILLPKAL